MKVLSVKEPYASLIKEKVKKIETRSWKTNYRGEIYLHASKKPLAKKEIETLVEQLSFLKNTDFPYGYIIAKATLVDCIPMTMEWIETVKKNHKEYITGDYRIGRYGWVLENIEPLTTPILAKGSLGIWNYQEECGSTTQQGGKTC